MPEGHVVHRLARSHRATLVGRRVTASSPQGRFAAGAAVIDGRVLTAVSAHGKHLLYEFDGAPVLHVHLGLYGEFRTFAEGDEPPPTPGTRLELRSPEAVVRLSGPAACELFSPGDVRGLLARLGPDPLGDDYDPELVWEALRRRRVAVGAALLDQRVLAGVGSAYRSEALFLCGVDPRLPASALRRDAFDCLDGTLRRIMRQGLERGAIETVPASSGPRRYVYRRAGEACLRCGATIDALELAGRKAYACPACQPSGAGA